MQKLIVSLLFFKYFFKESYRILLELENVLKRLFQLLNICFQWVRILLCRGEIVLIVLLVFGMSRELCFIFKFRIVLNYVLEIIMLFLLRVRFEKRKIMRFNYLMMLFGINVCIYLVLYILELYSRLVFRVQDIVFFLVYLFYLFVIIEVQLKGIR